MPYKIKGNAVVKKATGKVVGHSKNPKKYLRTLQAIEHGFVPRKANNLAGARGPVTDNYDDESKDRMTIRNRKAMRRKE